MSRYFAIIFLFFCINISLQAQWSQYGSAINGQGNNDQLGYEVSMNSAGDRLAVGLPFWANNDAGQVQVYEYVNGTWTLLGQSINGTSGGERAGWSLSINAAGDRVAIGAPFHGGRRGKVSVYEYNGTAWEILGSPILGEAGGDLSGWHTDINAAGDRVVIGARLNDGNGGNSGHARIYEYNSGSGNWVQLGQDIDGEFANDRSGISVAINDAGDRIATSSNRNGGGRGHTRIFEYGGTIWTQIGQDINGQSVGDQSGSGLDFNGAGNRIIIGSRLNAHSGIRSGHARVFEYNSANSSWSRIGGNLNGENGSDDFGVGVAINQLGDRVVVGGRQNDGNGSNSGHVRLYELSGGSWVQQGGDYDGLAAGDNFGHRVTINDAGDIFAVGAKLGSVNIFKGGQAIAYAESASCPDVDGDGFLDIACGGTDCNDNDSTIHPGATEVCDNIDNNCNSLVDGNDSTLVDIVGPTAICQNISITLDPSGNATIVAINLDNGSYDDCGSVSLNLADTSFDCSDIGLTQRSLVVTDATGNLDSCFSMITVSDTASPTAMCQNLSVYLDAAGNSVITAADIDGGSSDACGLASFQLDKSNFDCTNTGANIVTLSVTDSLGNTAACQSTVFVADTTSPTAVCQNLTTYLDASGNTSITTGDVDNGSGDACGLASFQLDKSNFDCTNTGANAVTLSVTDSLGNTAACQSTVFVADTTSSTAVCQNLTTYLDASGNTSITTGDVDNGSGDACGLASFQLDKSNFDCTNTGANTVTLSVTDSSGNTAACQSTVFVADTTSPTAVCQNLTAYLDASGNTSITTVDVDNGSGDACGLASFQLDKSNFDCTNTGANAVTLSVTDSLGNTAACQSTVFVADTTSSTAVCQNLTTYLDASGNTSITTGDVDNGSGDACGLASFQLDKSNFDCTNTGANTVTLSVTDSSGNTAACQSTVFVADTTSPTAVCQNLTAYLDASGNTSITTGDVDNGSGDACGLASFQLDKSNFDCTNTGANAVTLSVTDSLGNTAACQSTVFVADTTSPTAVCQDITVYLDAVGNATITTSDIDQGTADPCGIASLQLNINSFDCQDVGANAVILTATDNSSNTGTCQTIVWVVDTIHPLALCVNFSLPLNATGLGSLSPPSVDNGSQDACGVFNLSLNQNTFDCNDIGANVVFLTVTDNNLNTASCSATVTVSDTTPPTAICQDITVSLDGSTGQVFLLPADVDNMSSDACGISSLSISPNSFDCSSIGSQFVVLSATDVASNTSSCIAQVFVDDSQSKPQPLAQQNCNSCSQIRIFYCQFDPTPASFDAFIDGSVSSNSQYMPGNGLLWYEDVNGSQGPLYNGTGQQPPTPDMTQAVATYYFWVAQVSQITGCISDPIQVRARVRKTPIPVFASPGQFICEGTTLDLAAGISDINSAADSFYLYNQDPALTNAGLIAKFTATNGVLDLGQYYLVTPATGTHTYWVVAVRKGNANRSSCEGVDSMSFVISPVPVLNPVSNIDVCAGEPVQVALTSSPPGATFLWNNNNQSIGLGANGFGNIQFTAASNNTGQVISANITLYAYANNCLATPTSFSINIHPDAVLDTSSQIVCSDQPTGLQLNTIPGSPSASSYELVSVSFDPGLTPGPGNATPAPGLAANALAGDIFYNYTSNSLRLTYTLRLLNTLNCRSDLQTITLTVLPAPIVSSGLTDTVCSGQAANLPFTLSNLPGNASFQWAPRSLPQGITTAILTSPGSVFQDVLLNITQSPVDVIYDVRAMLGGCLGPASSSVIHVLAPAIPVSIDSLVFCEDDSFPNQAVFDLTSISYNQGGSQQLTYFRDIHLTQGILNPATFLSTNDTVYASLNNNVGYCSDHIEIYLRVVSLEVPQLDSSWVFCENSSQLLIPQPVAGAYFNFYDASPDSGGLIVGSGNSYDPMLNAGDSIAIWITTTDNLCESEAVKSTVQISPAPTAMATAILPFGTICEDDTLQLIGAGGPGYAWQGPNGFSAQIQNPTLPNITKASEGLYMLTVTNTFNCSDSDTVIALVDTLPSAGRNDTISILASALPVNLLDSLNGMPAGGGVWAGPLAPYNGDLGTFNPAWMPTGVYTYTQTSPAGCMNSNSVAAIWVQVIQSPCPRLRLKLFMEGPLDTATLLMRDDLRTSGYLPLTEPFSSAGYAHINGGGNENIPVTVLATSGQNAIVDWLYVELRNPQDSTVILGSRSVLLQRDGDVVELDGQSDVCFNRLAPGSYYVRAGHRNHIGAMTEDPVYLDSAVTQTVDFTSAMPSLFGINPQKIINSSLRPGGVKAFVSGDADGNGQVQNGDDVSYWILQVGGAGYYEADYNLDAQVQNFDRVFFWFPNVGRGTQVPQRSN